MFNINLPAEQKRTYLLFDLHGVLASFSSLQALRAATLLVKHNPFVLLAPIDPVFWYACYCAWHESAGHVPEVLFKAVARRRRYIEKSYEDFLYLLNSYVMDQSTITLLQEYKKQGFVVCLASNIGPDAWRLFAHTRSLDVSSMFNHIFTACEGAGGYIRKPLPSYFYSCLRSLGNPPARECIFFDDKEANIRAASAIGMHAVTVPSSLVLPDLVSETIGESNEFKNI